MVAGAEALRQGGDSSSVLALARAVPPRRSVAVPLEVVAQLAKGGMNVEEAVDKVRTRVHNDASDAALERWADETVVKFASRAPEKGKGKTAKVAKQGATSDVHQAGSPKSPATRKKAASAAHQTIP
jgi:hypothetical protein